MKNVFPKFLKTPLARENFISTLTVDNVECRRGFISINDVMNPGQLSFAITSFPFFNQLRMPEV